MHPAPWEVIRTLHIHQQKMRTEQIMKWLPESGRKKIMMMNVLCVDKIKAGHCGPLGKTTSRLRMGYLEIVGWGLFRLEIQELCHLNMVTVY